MDGTPSIGKIAVLKRYHIAEATRIRASDVNTERLKSELAAVLTGAAFMVTIVTCASTVTAKRPAPSSERESKAPQRPVRSCAAWTSQVLRDHDAGNRNTWRDVTIRSLPSACDAVPEGIRAAAARASTAKDATERSRILAAAVTSSLGNGCSIADPLADARQLAKACPLPKGLRFQLDEPVLMDLRAVDYGLTLALARGFMSTGAYDDAAERVILDFTLSAQIFGEDFRKGRTARGRQ